MKQKILKNLPRRVLLLLVVLLGAAVIWWRWASAPVSKDATTAIDFTIQKGEAVDTISHRLKRENLIRSSEAFKLTIIANNLAKRIQAGEFRLSQTWTTTQIAQALTHGTADLKVTLIEGWRREEMADELERKFRESLVSFDKEAFLKVTEGKEGYLFPDTYLIPKNTPPTKIASLLEETFEKRVDSRILDAVRRQGLSLEQALIIASIVEREVRTEKDRPTVAGIFIKRWRSDWPLQADATVQYALGFQEKEKIWWKKNLTQKDLEINSQFNTYERSGLPPAPICNPSLSSIQAVANQKASEYWYYISDKKGNLHYAKTIEEHNANIARYLNK